MSLLLVRWGLPTRFGWAVSPPLLVGGGRRGVSRPCELGGQPRWERRDRPTKKQKGDRPTYKSLGHSPLPTNKVGDTLNNQGIPNQQGRGEQPRRGVETAQPRGGRETTNPERGRETFQPIRERKGDRKQEGETAQPKRGNQEREVKTAQPKRVRRRGQPPHPPTNKEGDGPNNQGEGEEGPKNEETRGGVLPTNKGGATKKEGETSHPTREGKSPPQPRGEKDFFKENREKEKKDRRFF